MCRLNDSPLLKVKPEPVDDPGSKMQVDAEPIEGPATEGAKEEPSFKEKEEEVPAVHEEPMLKEPIESTPGVDRIVREIDVFLTPHVDSETNVRFSFRLIAFEINHCKVFAFEHVFSKAGRVETAEV